MTQEALAAILAQTAEQALAVDDPDQSYIDWSSRTSDGAWHLEVGNDNDAVVITLDRDAMQALVHGLAAALLGEVA